MSLIGWLTGASALVRISASAAPMPFSVALCFVAVGSAMMLATARRRRAILAIVLVPLILGAVALAQHFLSADRHLDDVMVAMLTTGALPTARMSPVTAVLLLVAAVAVLALGGVVPARRSAMIAGVCGSILSITGAAALLEYALGVESAYGMLPLTRMAIPSAALFIAIGVAVVHHTWRANPAGVAGLRWLPASAALAVTMGSALVWNALQEKERRTLERAVAAGAEVFRERIQTGLAVRVSLVERLSRQIGAASVSQRERVTLSGDIRSIIAVDSTFRVLWAAPTLPGIASGYDLGRDPARRSRLEAARHDRVVTVVGMEEPGDGTTLLLVVPTIVEGRLVGFSAGLTDSVGLLGGIPHQAVGARLAVANGADTLYRLGDTPHRGPPVTSVSLPSLGPRTQLHVWPAAPLVAGIETALPRVVLGGGLLVALMIAGTIAAAQQANRRAQEATRSRDLLREVEERMHLALTAAGTGTWHWRIGADEVVWDEQMHRLFGLQPGTFGGTYAAFNSLLHPDDRERVRDLVTIALRDGSQYDTEFRTMALDGSERYIAARGKLFAATPGIPARMTGVCWDITDRKRAEEERGRFASELQRSNAELERFAYVASHDLQEPLRMVASYVELLRKRYEGRLDRDADEFIGYAVGGARRLQQLIEDLLTFSRVGTRGSPLVATDSEAVFQSTIENLHLAIDQAGATVTHDRLPVVLADKVQLGQVFANLISNALKFRDSRAPVIHVSARRDDAEWVFSVRDNGIGIESQYFDRIFVIFQRLHGQQDYPGTGIGLALCKKIVERHGGHMSVESVAGSGSTFHFTMRAAGALET